MKRILVTAALVILLVSCASAGNSGAAGGRDASGADISARGAIGQLADTGPRFAGEGGRGISLAVTVPEVQGDIPAYLPMYIQGLLNSNLQQYSALTLVDRQNLDRIIGEQNLAAGGRFSDADFVRIGNLTNARYFLFGTVQKLSGNSYALYLAVTEASSGVRKATFTGQGTLAQLEGNGELINRASAEILSQLGIQLTETGRTSLLNASNARAQAQNALARGVAAQEAGSEVQALFNYAQAASFDPGQMEALARLGSLSMSISGGSVSERIMNDFQARDRWLAVFRETARFFDEHPPYEIAFDPALEQVGEPDYQRRTANLAMNISLSPSNAGFDALNALLGGLERTGRRGTWGFGGWPFQDLRPAVPGTTVLGGRNAGSFTVEVLLLNERGKRIGRDTITLRAEPRSFYAGDIRVTPPVAQFGIIRFQNVKVDDLTLILTIVINSVNGIPSRTLNATGYMRIAPEDLSKIVAEHKRQAEAERSRQEVARTQQTEQAWQAGAESTRQTAEERRRQAPAIAYFNSGNEYHALGNYNRAIVEYTQAIRLNPNYANAYFGRGNAYAYKGDHVRARADYTRALQIDPNHTLARGALNALGSRGR